MAYYPGTNSPAPNTTRQIPANADPSAGNPTSGPMAPGGAVPADPMTTPATNAPPSYVNSPANPVMSQALDAMKYWQNFVNNNPGTTVTNPNFNPQTNQIVSPNTNNTPPGPTTSPMAPGFAGGSTDSNVFTSQPYIKNLNQDIYATQANAGQAPAFTQGQFDTAWQNNMTQGAGDNYAAFNKAMGAQDVIGPAYQAATTTDPTMLAKMRLQNQINNGQISLAQATANNGGYVNPQSTAQANPMTQPGGGAPGQPMQGTAMQPPNGGYPAMLQMLQQMFGGGGQGSPAPGAGGLPGYNSWGNPFQGNPFAYMTGQAGGPFSSMMGGGMGGGFGNPMQGNYGQLGGVAQLLNAVQALQGGFGGRSPGYQSMYQNPFSGLGFGF